MRILGVDCGTELTGYGVIDSDGRSHRLVAADVIRTKSNIPLEYRLAHIGKELRQVIQAFTPQTVAVEAVFHSINAKSALKLAHVRGVALYLAAEANVPVAEYSPLEVKVSVVGYGRAEKHQVEMMVQSLLGIDRKFTSYDATDALAVAICHGARMNFSAAAGDYR